MPATFRSSTLRRYRDVARNSFLVTLLANLLACLLAYFTCLLTCLLTVITLKGAIWRQQQPASTTTALFIDTFKLDATQLLDLLKIGQDASYLDSLKASLTESADEYAENVCGNRNIEDCLRRFSAGIDRRRQDQVACIWLNNNTEVWEDWLPDDKIYSTFLAQWKWWLIVCGLCFFGVFWVEPYFGLLYRTCSERRARKLESNTTSTHVVSDITATEVMVSDNLLSITDEREAQVSFGQSQIHVRKGEHVVELVIVRLDTLPEPIDVTVSAIDASAIFGAHHSGFSQRSSGAAVGTPSLTFTLRPLERNHLVLLHIHDPSYSGLCRFSATLSVAAHGSIRAIVAPVKLIRVTIIETGSFPNGLLSEVLDELSPEASSRSGSLSALATEVHRSNTLFRPPRSLRRMATPIARLPKIFSSRSAELQGVVWLWRPVYHYLVEAVRWSFVKSGGFSVPYLVKYALGQIFVQAIKGFVEVSE